MYICMCVYSVVYMCTCGCVLVLMYVRANMYIDIMCVRLHITALRICLCDPDPVTGDSDLCS